MARVPFPDVPIGEFTVTRPFTAPGLFAYRHMQAEQLLHFPDMGGGDLSAEQRREALERMVNVQRPLAALVLFLTLVRHTVAHHAALVRPIDAPRFRHWEVQPNALLNPPIEFVREMSALLYRTGRVFEGAISNQLFSVILAKASPNWFQNPSELVVALVELFNWFGKLLTDNTPPLIPGSPNYEEQMRARATSSRARLMELCIEDLRRQYAV